MRRLYDGRRGVARTARLVSVPLAMVLLVVSCGEPNSKGSSAPAPLPSAPEPAVAPPLETVPVGRVVPVGTMPEGIVVDSTTGLVAVGLREPAGIALVDLEGQVVQRVDLDGAPRHLRLAGPGGPVLVPAEGSDQLVRVGLPDGQVSSVTRVGRNPHDAVALGERVFVANEFADDVSVVVGDEVVDETPAPLQPGGIAAGDDAVAVVGVRARQTKVFDAASLEAVGTVVSGAGPTHVVAEQDRAFVADTSGDAILALSLRPAVAEIARVEAAGAPYGMALDTARQRLWVTLTASNEIVAFDITDDQPRLVTRLASVRQPNSVAVDPSTGNVYVTGTADGVLQIIPADRIG